MPQATFPIQFPTTTAPVNVQFFNKRAAGVQESFLTGKQQVSGRTYDVTGLSIEMPILNAEQSGEMTAFLRRLEGQLGTFTFSPTNPLNTLNNNGTTLSATAVGAYDIQVNLPTGEPGTAKVGQFFSVQNTGENEILYTIVALTTKNSNGDFTMTVSPQVRKAIPRGGRINFVEPRGTYRLASNVPAWGIGPTNTTQLSLSCREVID